MRVVMGAACIIWNWVEFSKHQQGKQKKRKLRDIDTMEESYKFLIIFDVQKFHTKFQMLQMNFIYLFI